MMKRQYLHQQQLISGHCSTSYCSILDIKTRRSLNELILLRPSPVSVYETPFWKIANSISSLDLVRKCIYLFIYSFFFFFFLKNEMWESVNLLINKYIFNKYTIYAKHHYTFYMHWLQNIRYILYLFTVKGE